MTKSKPAAAPSKPKPKTPAPSKRAAKDSPAPEASSLAAAYARFLPEAQQLTVEQVVPCRQDVNLAFANVQTGLAAVLPHLERLRDELPRLQVDRFDQLGELAGALLYAAAQASVGTAAMKRDEMDEHFARLYALREPMLLCAEALALLGLLPRARVEHIRSGRGAFDAAQDGTALADLYAEFAPALRNKHPFTNAQFAEIAELGHKLLRSITPAGARPRATAQAATAARDRLYSLLLLRHAELRRAGFYLFGEALDEKVPTLSARKGRTKADPTASEPPSPLPAHPAPPPPRD